ncbi:hypothetical protein ABT340_04725 [Streptosporangium sp. NPDC000239]|uniref:hypothetical protein n=1 Tax=Streptosporangium sp. NPDC000239 TaxID=3154248 RepID=UPI00332705D5
MLALLGGLVSLLDSGELKVADGGGDETSVPVPMVTTDTLSPFVSGIPKPNAQQTEDLLSGLREINPGLDQARSIDRARNTCSDLLAGKDRKTVIINTGLRFNGGDAHIDAADAEKIVALIEKGGWCEIG